MLQMKSLIIHYLEQLAFYILAPLYFHFNQFAFVYEFAIIVSDVIDILGTYYLFFFILICSVFLRNRIFVLISNLIFQSYNFKSSRTNFLNFFRSFWNYIKNFKSKK